MPDYVPHATVGLIEKDHRFNIAAKTGANKAVAAGTCICSCFYKGSESQQRV